MTVTRLAFGLEIADAVTGAPAVLTVAREGGAPLHSSSPGRYALPFPFRSDLGSPARVLVADPGRRFVPRRLEIPFASLAEVLAEEDATRLAPYPRMTGRGRMVRVFPGAAYGPDSSATGIRGRVLAGIDGPPVRWTRVRARRPGQPQLGVAHGDDRGEFLLLLGPDRLVPTEFPLEVTVTAGALQSEDPPLEGVTAPPEPDPSGYSVSVTVTVDCRLGRLLSPPPFVLPV